MSASFEQLEKRVAFLEREQRRTNAIIDGLEERSDKNLGKSISICVRKMSNWMS